MDEKINIAAKRLREAAEKNQICNPIREIIGETDVDSAYKIQAINNQIRIENGAKVIGKKIGLTSKAVQKQLGVNQPDYGLLFDDKEVLNGEELPFSEIMQGKAEAEIAFVLAQNLDQEKISTIDILSAIDYALVAIEIAGSRIKNWDIKITDTIADNASASHFVLGHRPVKISNLDLINCEMKLYKNDYLRSEGTGSACLGSPINATLWLAKQMVKMGNPLQKGDILLSGALGPMINIEAGDKFTASIEGLGEASVFIGN